jgi:hypothetical protein
MRLRIPESCPHVASTWSEIRAVLQEVQHGFPTGKLTLQLMEDVLLVICRQVVLAKTGKFFLYVCPGQTLRIFFTLPGVTIEIERFLSGLFFLCCELGRCLHKDHYATASTLNCGFSLDGPVRRDPSATADGTDLS